MPRLANPLVFDLLELADLLAKQSGRANLKQAVARRAVSNAYYAVFHALCSVCSMELASSKRIDLGERIYRSLDHAVARKRLTALASRPGATAGIRLLGTAFGELQDRRHLADYSRPGSLFSTSEVIASIQEARDMVAFLGALSREERRALAIELLVAKAR